MPQVQQTFRNDKNEPIYVSVEPWPERFELEPADKLTLIWDAPETGDAIEIQFFNERELVVWPLGRTDGIEFLFNGEPGYDRTWVFKHKQK